MVYTMKTKYLFAKCDREITRTTLWVDVTIENSTQDQRDMSFFMQLAKFTTFFFARWSNAAQEFLDKVNESLRDENDDVFFHLPRCTMSAKKLRSLLKSGDYDNFARTFVAASESLSRRHFCAHDAYAIAMERASESLANPHNVKNLKPGRKAA